MRVVGGKYRHRLLTYPNDVLHIRPTKDRIREAIFSAIGNLSNFDVLDLYAGSGAMGIEALSRNASHAYFVDINPIAIKTITNNLENIRIPKENFVICFQKDVEALEYFKKEEIRFDVVFLDPPYKQGQYQEIVSFLLNNSLIKEGGIIVCESDYKLDLPITIFKKVKEYHYGEIIVTILWR